MALIDEAMDAARVAGVSRTAAHERASRDATDWIAAFADAWREADSSAARKLFAEYASYFWGPFERIDGLDAIVARWASQVDERQHLRFDYGVLAIEGDTTIAHWHALVDQDDGCVELNGIMCVTLDADGRCREFREWWDSRVVPID